MNTLMFQEITPHSETDDRWNDVIINAGASQSTLQDIKLPECAGCFTYQNSGDLTSPCSNRFIYWRTNHDVIQLVEISLDATLRSNRLRLRFQNTPILRGVSVHEYRDQVVLLVPTVSAIHKIVFPHPKNLESHDFHVSKNDRVSPSVFYNTSLDTLRNRTCSFVLNHVSLGIPLPHTSCSWLDAEANATFILANSAGSVLMVAMSDRNGVEITTTELMKTGSIFRLLNGLVPTAIRSTKTEIALSIICYKDALDTLVCSLFSDLQIRIWSHKKQECILLDSVINFDYEKKLSGGNFTAHQCHLRKSEGDESFYLGVYVPVPHQKIFYIFKPLLHRDQCKLKLVSILHQTAHDLVDFSIGESRIWTLWLSSENQPIVLTAVLDCDRKSEQMGWMPVNLEPRVSRTIDYGSSNPQEAYLKEIFKVGRFLPSTIHKAISIYNTTKNSSFSLNTCLKLEDLRNWVIEAVETEILMKTGDIENSENPYLDISAECWDRFFSYCIQYHEVGMKPLGIALVPNTRCTVLIKKNFYSLLCPCDSLELIMSPNFRTSLYFIDFLDDDNKKLYSSFKAVLECVDMVKESIDIKLLMRFEDKLLSQKCPIKYASQICKSLNLDADGSFHTRLRSMMLSNSETVSCLLYLLSKLDLTDEAREAFNETSSKYSSFANSTSGTGALCAGLAQFARQRFEFCRNLLLFELVLYESDAMECEQLDNLLVQTAIVPRTVALLRSYYVILWCTQCESAPVSSVIQDAAFKQFCLLELPEFTSTDLTDLKQRQTVCHLFFQGEGGSKARKIMEAKLESSAFRNDWESLYPKLIVAAATLLWPQEDNVVFPEFLFAQCQHAALQEYDCLLQGWCLRNKQFLDFLVASSYLILGKSKIACKMFLDVSKEIERESLLCNKILVGRYNVDADASIASLFCMRVIQMFEQFSESECIVKLARAVLNEINEKDPHIPIFYSVLFKHHLNLEHFEEAFATLVKNPDSSRRKDCLRQLIVKLCEVKQFQKIIELSYLAFEEEVIGILESRARCSDLCQNSSFYGILYSLHIHHKKFRKAASVMYELAMRYGREVISLKGLKKQVSCYLAAINCLHLSEPEYAWIVKPSHSPSETSKDLEAFDLKNSPKRNSEGDEIIHANRPVKVEVLGLQDVLQEYNLAKSRLLHAQRYYNTSSSVITPLTAEETVALLLNGGLFDAAIQLSKAFSLSLVPVFEAFVYKCLTSTLPSDTLGSNGLDKYSKHNDSSKDFASPNSMKGMQLWHLLEKYLMEHEPPGKSDLHRCVTEKLLTHGAALPAWLKLSFQKRNFTELASLYISHGLLDESIVLVHSYVKAILGIRKEDFNLQFSLHVNSPPVWLPHTYIDILLDAAKGLQEDKHFRELYEDFTSTLNEYNKTVESISAARLSNSSNG